MQAACCPCFHLTILGVYPFRVITDGRKRERRDSEGHQGEKIKLSLQTSESGHSKTTTEKGISGSPKSAERKRKFPEVDAQSGGFSSLSEEEEGQELFEPSTLSFEDHLTYDQPQKKKKVDNPSLSAGEEDQWHSPCSLCHPSPNSSCASQQSPSPRRTSEKRAAQEPPEAPQPKRVRFGRVCKSGGICCSCSSALCGFLAFPLELLLQGVKP